MASNRATLLLLAMLALSILVVYQSPASERFWWIMLPSLLLIINFFLALLTRQILINNWPLLLFHFALIALVLLIFLGQMTFFRATLELAEDEEFSGQLENIQQGRWHQYGLTQTRFRNRGFQIRYRKGIKRDRTLNQIEMPDANGQRQIVEIGDHTPLVFGHYRFYTTHNKGYAPIFEWQAFDSSEVIVGSIHLPAYPTHEFAQTNEWVVPGTDQTLWTLLQIQEEVLPEDRDFKFKIPKRHNLVIRIEDQRYQLNPGDELKLSTGILKYQKLSSWMGYRVDYDWTRPWLLSNTLLGLLGLFLHFVRKRFQVDITTNESRF